MNSTVSTKEQEGTEMSKFVLVKRSNVLPFYKASTRNASLFRIEIGIGVQSSSALSCLFYAVIEATQIHK